MIERDPMGRHRMQILAINSHTHHLTLHSIRMAYGITVIAFLHEVEWIVRIRSHYLLWSVYLELVE